MPEPTIEYSVRELIERLDHKIDQFIDLMNAKADRSDVDAIRNEMVSLGARLSHVEHRLEKDEQRSKDRRDWRRWLVPTLFSAILAVATVVAMLFHL